MNDELTRTLVVMRHARASQEGSDLERDLDTLFDDFRRRLRWPSIFTEGPITRGELSIAPLDVYEQGDEVVVKAELPGIAKDDLEISLSDSTLTVKGEKRRHEEKKQEDYTYSERSFGMISRTVELPAEVKADQAKASLKDGVLEMPYITGSEDYAHFALQAPSGSNSQRWHWMFVSDADKKKARYRETDHVKAYYRTNRY